MITRYFALGLALALGSCAASHSTTTTAPPPARFAQQEQVQHLDSLTLRNWLPLDLTTLGLPPYLVPAPAGSSPRQRRQWQRAQAQNLARAGVLPDKVKNSSVATAPGATSINRPASTVATGAGSVATDARKAGQHHGASAAGPGAVATNKSGGAAWWWYLVAVVAGAVGWELLTSKVAPLRQLLGWRIP
ncbi:MAG: hypothetical protein ACRYFK_16830 [Janthinobacterium lividum]